jgi:hypothetical protein
MEPPTAAQGKPVSSFQTETPPEESSVASAPEILRKVENVERPKDDNAYEKAYQLSFEAAGAFHNIDALMAKNDGQIISLLEQINKSFTKLAKLETGLKYCFEEEPSSATPSQPDAAVPPSSTPKDFLSPQRAEGSHEDRDTQCRKRAMLLSLEAARAFNQVEADMLKNDETAAALLSEMSRSFAKLAALDDGLIPLYSLQRPLPVVTDIGTSKSTASAADPIKLSPPRSITEPTSVALSSPNIQRAHDLSRQAAQAFNRADASMVSNGEAILSLLEEIEVSFCKLAAMDGGLSPLLVPEAWDPSEQLTRPSEMDPEPRAMSPLEKTSSSDNSSASSDEERARILSIEAARAFNAIDSSMVSNDQKTILLLNEINDSFDKLSTLDGGLSFLYEDGEKPLSHSLKEDTPVPDSFGKPPPVHHASTQTPMPSATAKPEVSDDDATKLFEIAAREEAKRLSLEAAREFNALEAKMICNYERALSLLADISKSFAVLAEASDEGTTPSNGETRTETLDLSPAALPEPSHIGPETPQHHSIREEAENSGRVKAQKLSTDAARAFHEVDSTMDQNDKKMLALLEEINASFAQLSSLNNFARSSTNEYIRDTTGDTNKKQETDANAPKTPPKSLAASSATYLETLQGSQDTSSDMKIWMRGWPITIRGCYPYFKKLTVLSGRLLPRMRVCPFAQN